jgi:hypothetical protein
MGGRTGSDQRRAARVIGRGFNALRGRYRLDNENRASNQRALNHTRQLGRAGVTGRVQTQQALRMQIAVSPDIVLVKVGGLDNAAKQHRKGHRQRNAPANPCD